MGIENVMYFALGVLVAGLIALIIVPAVWQRAVRLTKKRIEAATPMTMAEFRADKDQLRAEFALSTRRLEMNVEALRRRLADQLRDINHKKTELGGMKGERDQHLQVVRELEERAAELRNRNLELEKESADSAQKLRMRDREYAEKVSQLETAREALRNGAAEPAVIDGRTLSGDYKDDIDDVRRMLDTERRRSSFLEEQNRNLITQLETSHKTSAQAINTAANLREKLAHRDDDTVVASNELVAAEARIADAENRVSTILAETSRVVTNGEQQRDVLLAEKLKLEDELEQLRVKIGSVEATVMADWDSDRIEQSHLREKLNDIAADVSRLVYALEGNAAPPEDGGSLFDRVQKFAGDATPEPPRRQANGVNGAGSAADHAVSDRLKALRELQDQG